MYIDHMLIVIPKGIASFWGAGEESGTGVSGEGHTNGSPRSAPSPAPFLWSFTTAYPRSRSEEHHCAPFFTRASQEKPAEGHVAATLIALATGTGDKWSFPGG